MFGKRESSKGSICPLIKGECVEQKCRFWVHLLGNNPQTGKPIDEFDCSIRFLPVLLIENAQQSRQAGAAVESLRNEVAAGHRQIATAIAKSEALPSQPRAVLPANLQGDNE